MKLEGQRGGAVVWAGEIREDFCELRDLGCRLEGSRGRATGVTVWGSWRPAWLGREPGRVRRNQQRPWKSASGIWTQDVVAKRSGLGGFREGLLPRYISSSSQWRRWLALVRMTPWVVNFRERGRGKWPWHHRASHSGSQMVINLGQEAPRFPQVLWLHRSCRKWDGDDKREFFLHCLGGRYFTRCMWPGLALRWFAHVGHFPR